jgi:hypothetical protein
MTKHGCTARRGEDQSVPEWQVWAKPQQNGSLAVLVVNTCDASHCKSAASLSLDLTISLKDLFVSAWEEESQVAVPTSVRVRDLWSHSDTGVAGELKVENVAGHDGVFVLLTPQ